MWVCGILPYAPGSAVLTVEYKINLLSPADGDRYLAEAWVIKRGRTLTVTQALAVDAEGGVPIAAMTATLMTSKDEVWSTEEAVGRSTDEGSLNSSRLNRAPGGGK